MLHCGACLGHSLKRAEQIVAPIQRRRTADYINRPPNVPPERGCPIRPQSRGHVNLAGQRSIALTPIFCSFSGSFLADKNKYESAKIEPIECKEKTRFKSRPTFFFSKSLKLDIMACHVYAFIDHKLVYLFFSCDEAVKVPVIKLDAVKMNVFY